MEGWQTPVSSAEAERDVHPRIIVLMPRNMHFGPSNATSIDLCVHDLVRFSRYRDRTTVICQENDTLFPDLDVLSFSDRVGKSTRRKITHVRRLAADKAPDLVVVQQHLPTAAALARKLPVPVIWHTHNFSKPVAGGSYFATLRRGLRLRSFRSLGGIIFVSEAALRRFDLDWPEVETLRAVVPNGLDFDAWKPRQVREREILCVGRAAPEKGIKEAAMAVRKALTDHPDWRSCFILSEPNTHREYFDDVISVLAPVSSQVRIELSQPWSVVKERSEAAAIALVPSKWDEPFGRTALEAHAGGCAVVSSGTGGLSEISGSNAIMLPAGFGAQDIAMALEALISKPALCQDLAARGLEHARKNFSLESVSSKADHFYDQVRSSA